MKIINKFDVAILGLGGMGGTHVGTFAEAHRMMKAEEETGNFLQIGFELH